MIFCSNFALTDFAPFLHRLKTILNRFINPSFLRKIINLHRSNCFCISSFTSLYFHKGHFPSTDHSITDDNHQLQLTRPVIDSCPPSSLPSSSPCWLKKNTLFSKPQGYHLQSATLQTRRLNCSLAAIGSPICGRASEDKRPCLVWSRGSEGSVSRLT
ncbi:hypothetical protein AVEN_132863-1 [Araneus ventricosus]|uniref:Uncharacterized protein n=1 Tax=Araneus ventricosus TaxID=182803 RepID=A0A4Y2GRL9_ARAVE|nr:hypothetical protein AVEN_132863-1 [Araneus ventricosus]